MGLPPFGELKNKEKEQKFKKFVWEWFNTHAKNNNKPSCISHKKYVIQKHLVPFFGETPLDKISVFQIEKYKALKIKKGLAPKTINNHLIVLGTCLRTAQEWVGLEKIPKIKKLKLPPPQTVYLEHEECEAILKHLAGVWRELVLVAIRTGLRIGELQGLRWQDVNWQTRTITVRHSWCPHANKLISPKSNKERQIPMFREVYNLFIKKAEKTGFVFKDQRGEMFYDKRLNKEIAKACKKAGVKYVSCHKLRHTFASHLAMAGVALVAIQRLLGHADIQTTMRYAHLSQSNLEGAIDKLRPFDDQNKDFGNNVATKHIWRMKDLGDIQVYKNEKALINKGQFADISCCGGGN